MPNRRHFALCALLLALLPACQARIGDPCARALDCSQRGERQCDLSNASNAGGRGECTIENCSFGSCPAEGLCVKTYSSEFLSVACNPDTEDITDPDERTDDCDVDEVCLPEGLCADEITARTSCRRRCSTDSQCRAGYRCDLIGGDGVYVAPDPDDPTDVKQGRICVPE